MTAVARASSPHAAKACPERREGVAALRPGRETFMRWWHCSVSGKGQG